MIKPIWRDFQLEAKFFSSQLSFIIVALVIFQKDEVFPNISPWESHGSE